MCSDDNFDLFWARLLKLQEEFEVNEARKRRSPSRLDDGTAAPEFHPAPKTYYRQIYYETIDLAASFILQWFDQPALKTYRILQDLLFKAAMNDEFKFVIEFYKEDFNEASLKVQLELFTTGFKEANIQ